MDELSCFKWVALFLKSCICRLRFPAKPWCAQEWGWGAICRFLTISPIENEGRRPWQGYAGNCCSGRVMAPSLSPTWARPVSRTQAASDRGGACLLIEMRPMLQFCLFPRRFQGKLPQMFPFRMMHPHSFLEAFQLQGGQRGPWECAFMH